MKIYRKRFFCHNGWSALIIKNAVMNKISQETLDTVIKAYDIRGMKADGLNEYFFETLGKAFVTYLGAKKIAVGHDIREDNIIFQKNFIKGARSLGCDIVDLGLIATEQGYFASGYLDDVDGCAIVTTSHNPAGWSGCKMVGKGAVALSGDKGLAEIKQLMLEDNFSESDLEGDYATYDIYPEFKNFIESIIGDEPLGNPKIIVDAGNGIGGHIFDYVFGDKDLQLTKMYFEMDGDFPNHVPNPMEDENVIELREKMKTGEYDIGISIDGDADRVAFIDKEGRNPAGVYVGTMIAKHLLENSESKKIIHDPRIIWPITKELQPLGAETIMIKAGHSFFKNIMKDEDALFGMELSSHFYYRDIYYADSGMITLAIMLRKLANGMDFTKDLGYYFDNYPVSGEVNYVVENVQEIVDKIEQIYKEKGAKIDYTDGISVIMDDFRFNLRSSNTQPLLRLNLEAQSRESIVKNFLEVESLIDAERDNEPVLDELKNND